MTIVEGNVNSQKYITLLQELLIPFFDTLPLSARFKTIFQQDNATHHFAAATRAFLRDNSISVPLWPALSPDMNPIENVWALMKRWIRSKRPTSLDALRACILQAWQEIVTPDLCLHLYASMYRRLHNVISRRGIR